MARPKEFDRDEALVRAMEVFWRKGYEATSLSDLTAALGIGRQSLYDTFGDKQALYLAALERYRAGGKEAREALKQGSAIAAVRKLFLSIADEPDETRRLGCMMVNAITERVPADKDTAKVCTKNQKDLVADFRRALERARDQGELPWGNSIDDLAVYLASSLNGLRVTAKAGAEPDALRRAAKLILAPLSP